MFKILWLGCDIGIKSHWQAHQNEWLLLPPSMKRCRCRRRWRWKRWMPYIDRTLIWPLNSYDMTALPKRQKYSHECAWYIQHILCDTEMLQATNDTLRFRLLQNNLKLTLHQTSIRNQIVRSHQHKYSHFINFLRSHTCSVPSVISNKTRFDFGFGYPTLPLLSWFSFASVFLSHLLVWFIDK